MTAERRTALVTGSNRGIGLAIATAFARTGHDIILHGRTRSAQLDGIAADLVSQYGVNVELAVCDLLDAEQVEGFVSSLPRTPDIVVNNAGFETMHRLEAMPTKDWQATLDVNLTAVFAVSRDVAAQWIASRRGGVILNISSIHDTVPRKGFAAYSVAKAGLSMLTNAAALEWAEFGIRVVGISPGAIETDINRDAIEALGRKDFESWIPAGRIGELTDVTEAALFLASDQARYITGTTLRIDGGYSLGLVRYDLRT